MQKLKENFHPVMADIERRLIALESRPVETSISNVSFTEENPPTLTTLIEGVQVLESRVNNMEPSLSTLHSSISSTPIPWNLVEIFLTPSTADPNYWGLFVRG